MLTKKFIIKNDCMGFESINTFVELTSKFDSSIYIETENKKISAKSIIGILSMKLQDGDEITVLVSGEDEDKALKKLEEYFNN